MKRAALLSIFLLAIGLVAGFFGRGLWDTQQTQYVKMQFNPPPATSIANGISSDSSETTDASEPTGNLPVLMTALRTVEFLKAKDYTGLSQLIHPTQGVCLVPYSTVDTEVNLTFTPQDIANLENDTQLYIWGTQDGKGTPIELTMSAYFSSYVFNVDYTMAPVIGINEIVQTGNSLENVAEAFPDAQFVEFHYPSVKRSLKGMDWCSLKVVMEPYQSTYKIIALVHSQWTA